MFISATITQISMIVMLKKIIKVHYYYYCRRGRTRIVAQNWTTHKPAN